MPVPPMNATLSAAMPPPYGHRASAVADRAPGSARPAPATGWAAHHPRPPRDGRHRPRPCWLAFGDAPSGLPDPDRAAAAAAVHHRRSRRRVRVHGPTRTSSATSTGRCGTGPESPRRSPAKVASRLDGDGSHLTLAVVLPGEPGAAGKVIGEALLKYTSVVNRQGEVGYVLNPAYPRARLRHRSGGGDPAARVRGRRPAPHRCAPRRPQHRLGAGAGASRHAPGGALRRERDLQG